jgi:hypothetical protein
MAARITLKAINAELARIGATARLARGGGYFYFQFGEAASWLDRTVQVRKVSDLDLKQWIGEYRRLKKLNAESCAVPNPPVAVKPEPHRGSPGAGQYLRRRFHPEQVSLAVAV